MGQEGYVTGETLVDTEGNSIVLTVSTWLSLDDWKAWETPESASQLGQLTQPFWVESPKISTYQLTPTENGICQDSWYSLSGGLWL